MKSHTRASVRTAGILATISPSDDEQPAVGHASGDHRKDVAEGGALQVSPEPTRRPSALELTYWLTRLQDVERELRAEMERIFSEYPPAAKLKADMLSSGEGMKERHTSLVERVEGFEGRLTELAAWLQQRLAQAAPAPELQEELERIRDEYPTAAQVEERFLETFGHPEGRVTRLEGRVGSMDERMTELALRLQQLEAAAPAPTRSPTGSGRKKTAAK